MEPEIFKKAIDAAPILAIALGAVLLVIYWALKEMREARAESSQKIIALVAEINTFRIAQATIGGQAIEAINHGTQAINASVAAIRDVREAIKDIQQ